MQGSCWGGLERIDRAVGQAATSPTVIATFIAQPHEVAAGVKQQLQADAGRLPGLRLLPERFMVIQQAMGLPKGRGAEAAAIKAPGA